MKRVRLEDIAPRDLRADELDDEERTNEGEDDEEPARLAPLGLAQLFFLRVLPLVPRVSVIMIVRVSMIVAVIVIMIMIVLVIMIVRVIVRVVGHV